LGEEEIFTKPSAQVQGLLLRQTMPLNDGKLDRPPIEVKLEGIVTLLMGSPSNAPELSWSVGAVVVKLTYFKFEQLANAPDWMLSTWGGMVIEVSPVQPEKALALILVTDGGRTIDARERQLAKVLSAMVVTEDGLTTEASEVQPSKALWPMLSTAKGIVIFAREKQPRNALEPMFSTESGRVTDLSLAH